jgi:hypothetical protein
MWNLEFKECSERLRILTGAYSELQERMECIVKIPELKQYRLLVEGLEKLIAAESEHLTELLDKVRQRNLE